MIRSLFKMLVVLVCCTTALQFAESEMKPPIRIMILGTYHMSNPGLDVHNMKADDVTTPERQKQLEIVANHLARFNPNKIALERYSKSGDLIDQKYPEFTPDQLKINKDERVQVGFRLAKKLGHTTVYAIDEHSEEINYFPFEQVQKFAKDSGNAALLEDISKTIETKVKAFEQSQRTKTVAELLMEMNRPGAAKEDQELGYYSLLKLSDASQYPGADLNAYWYMRNAKIFSKLLRVAKPGDRILVMFGAGHNFWLRHFVENTDGCELVEPHDYLRAN